MFGGQVIPGQAAGKRLGNGMDKFLQAYKCRISIEWWVFALTGLFAVAITLLTVSFQNIKTALMNPVKSLRSE